MTSFNLAQNCCTRRTHENQVQNFPHNFAPSLCQLDIRSAFVICSQTVRHSSFPCFAALCMVLAWVLFASVGVLMPRYYKEAWPNSTLCTVKVWFAVSSLISFSEQWRESLWGHMPFQA